MKLSDELFVPVFGVLGLAFGVCTAGAVMILCLKFIVWFWNLVI